MTNILTLSFLLAVIVAVSLTLDIPKYDVISKENGYEVREYPSTMWVCTTDSDPENIKGMFLRLFYYMQGANSEGRTLEMTAPMLRHHHVDGNVSLMLYLPTLLQKNSPLPTDAAVNVTELPAQQYAVRQFGGFATDEIWTEELETFKEMAKDDGNITSDEYFAASYSGFHDLVDRRNEIWLIRTEMQEEEMSE